MLTLNGTLLTVLELEARKLKTGELIPARVQAQIQTAEVLEDGQVKIGLQTITVPHRDVVKARPGEPISLPVRPYVAGRDVRFLFNPIEAPAASVSA